MYNNGKTHRSGMPAVRRPVHPAVRTHESEDVPLFQKVLINSLFGFFGMALSGIALISIAAFIACACEDPSSMISPMALCALFPSAFIGGLISSKKTGEAPLYCGILTAAVTGIAMLLCSLCLVNIRSSEYHIWQRLFMHSMLTVFCILGAFAGNIKRRPNPRKRRFRA